MWLPRLSVTQSMADYLSGLMAVVQAGLTAEQKKLRYLSDPALWAKDHLDVDLWSKQQEIGQSIVKNRNTAVAAAHSVGKSFSVAVFMAWWVDVHPIEEVFVASTAPFADQISAILWRELRGLHKRSADRFEAGLVDHRLPGYITGDNRWKMDDGRLIGQGRKPPDNKEDSGYQGLHAKYLFAVGDEAAGLSQGMIDALGNITTGEFCRRLIIANPTDPNSYMGRIYREKTGTWNLMHISAFDSPNLTNEDFPSSAKSALVNQEYIDDKLRDYGEDDPNYISRVLGQWAFDEGNNVFTDIDLAHAGNAHVLPDPEAIIEFGCDIARMGSDSTFVYSYQEGDVWECDEETNKPIKASGVRGARIRALDGWRKAPLVSSDPANLGSAERIHAHALAAGAKIVKVDASGLGSGVIDGLAMLNKGQYRVVEIFGGATSSDGRAWINARAEQFFSLKTRFFNGTIDLDSRDSELLDEFRSVVYEYNDKGVKKIQSKEAMKRANKKSPDRADAFWYAAMNVKHLISGPQPGDIIKKTPDQIMKELLLSGYLDSYPY
jgi:hypothetical protein